MANTFSSEFLVLRHFPGFGFGRRHALISLMQELPAIIIPNNLFSSVQLSIDKKTPVKNQGTNLLLHHTNIPIADTEFTYSELLLQQIRRGLPIISGSEVFNLLPKVIERNKLELGIDYTEGLTNVLLLTLAGRYILLNLECQKATALNPASAYFLSEMISRNLRRVSTPTLTNTLNLGKIVISRKINYLNRASVRIGGGRLYEYSQVEVSQNEGVNIFSFNETTTRRLIFGCASMNLS